MEIKNTTKFKYDEILEQINSRPLKGMKKVMVMLIIYGILLVVLFILYLTGKREKNSLITIIVLSVIFIALLVLFMFFPKYYKKASLRNSQNFVKGVTYNYTFLDDKVLLNAVLSGKKTDLTIDYNILYKVVITEEIVFLYITKASYYMVKKAGFAKGEEKIVIDTIEQYLEEQKKA